MGERMERRHRRVQLHSLGTLDLGVSGAFSQANAGAEPAAMFLAFLRLWCSGFAPDPGSLCILTRHVSASLQLIGRKCHTPS